MKSTELSEEMLDRIEQAADELASGLEDDILMEHPTYAQECETEEQQEAQNKMELCVRRQVYATFIQEFTQAFFREV